MRTCCAVLLCLACSPAAVLAQPETVWKRYHDAGWQEFKGGKFKAAREYLKKAQETAEGIAKDDPRVAVTLSCIALVDFKEGKTDDIAPSVKRALELVAPLEGGAEAILTYNNVFVPGGPWLLPNSVLTGRLARITAEFTF